MVRVSAVTPRLDWARLRAALWTRCGGRCEVSGIPLDRDTFDAHHRQNKGMGGTRRAHRDALSNLLALDPIVHNGGPLSVHGRRGWSQPRGYLLSKLDPLPPAARPVLLHGARWVWLTDDGCYAGRPNA